MIKGQNAPGLMAPAPKQAQYTREQRKAFKSGAVPDPRPPKMSQPAQAQPQPQPQPQPRPAMPQQQQPQPSQMQNGFNQMGAQQLNPMFQNSFNGGMWGNFQNPMQQYKPMLPDPGFSGGFGGGFQMGAGFPGGAPLPQNQGYNPPLWKR